MPEDIDSVIARIGGLVDRFDAFKSGETDDDSVIQGMRDYLAEVRMQLQDLKVEVEQTLETLDEET